VIAFEPLGSSVEVLRHNLALNGLGNVDILELALGNEAGRATLVPGRDEDQSVLVDSSDPAAASEAVRVEVETVDGLVASGRIPAPDIIKMDVEGAEVGVVRGAATTLSTHRPTLLVEVHDCWAQLQPLLDDHGYCSRVLEHGRALPSPEPTHILAAPGPRQTTP
jgi:FkbM family methyltransferase